MVQLGKRAVTGATIVNSDLYDQPALYDELFPVGEHLPYYMGLARQASGGVLELACGSGQITVPIASAGLPIAGLDLSQPLLDAARERPAAANVSVEFALGDMRNFDLGRKFALIFIARNSLLHLHSTEDLLAAFAAIRRHLVHGGIFAFDIFNPSVRLLARPPGQRFPVFEKETSSFGKSPLNKRPPMIPPPRWATAAGTSQLPGSRMPANSRLTCGIFFLRNCPFCWRQEAFTSKSAPGTFRKRSSTLRAGSKYASVGPR